MEEIWRNKNMKTIIKQSADGIFLIGDNNFDTTQGKVFINNHEITDIDTFFKVAEENTKLINQQKEFIEYLEEEMEKNINWYNSLTPHDKNYYYKDYVDKDTNYMVVLQKYKEITGGKDER